MTELKQQAIRKLSEREHILKRSSMYLGSSVLTTSNEYILANKTFNLQEVEYVPGLVKIFNELIDNSIDEHVRTNGKHANKIEVKMNKTSFEVKDNGRGIPVDKIQTEDGLIYQPELAWTHARSGSNFDDDTSSTIGTNGVGSMIASVFSKRFIGISNDGSKTCTVECSNNNETVNTFIGKGNKHTGVQVEILPDLDKFGISDIDDTHIKMIEQRLHNLSVSYPNIKFSLNGKSIKLQTKDFLEMFGAEGTLIEHKQFSIGVFQSNTDDFKQFSLMNGLNLSGGGTHMDYIANNITSRLRDKIIKKYKLIKPADIKQKLFIVCTMNNFEGPKYESQTKEKLTNPNKDIIEYFNELDFDQLVKRIYSNKPIIDNIIDYFKIKEEYQKQKDLKGLAKKTTKRIKSDKYFPATKRKEILIAGEGQSALGSLIPALGREHIGYFELKGKPLNCMNATLAKFKNNKELTELFAILNNEGYEYFVCGTDADLDGLSIRMLLISFIIRYKPDMMDRFGYLETPVIIIKKKGKLVRWHYSLNDKIKLNSGEESQYMKGLGTFNYEDLKYIVEKDGIENMIRLLDFSNLEPYLNWLEADRVGVRKDQLMDHTFSIAKV